LEQYEPDGYQEQRTNTTEDSQGEEHEQHANSDHAPATPARPQLIADCPSIWHNQHAYYQANKAEQTENGRFGSGRDNP
jgi:hypothetical protein